MHQSIFGALNEDNDARKTCTIIKLSTWTMLGFYFFNQLKMRDKSGKTWVYNLVRVTPAYVEHCFLWMYFLEPIGIAFGLGKYPSLL